ncbi:MAG: hypothetical protein IT332_01390 [Ardenticatenales bacterium]|nr:hypothetical protein [Ardenticatenales bacterium]
MPVPMTRRAVGALLAAMAFAPAVIACRPGAPPPVSADIVAMMSGPTEGFARAVGPRPLLFPDDEGAHPEYRTEWWYYTGHLFAQAGESGATESGVSAVPVNPNAAPSWLLERDTGDRRRFGFQLTFFRSSVALPMAASAAPPSTAWTTTQAYLAHFTVTDVAADRFHSAERLARGAIGLAGARAEPYHVWLGPWSAAAHPGGVDGGHAATAGVRLRAADGPAAIDVTVRPVKSPALHGQAGWSRKGPEPGNASYYYSFTRLAATGVVTTAAGVWPVEGGVWMDHEWSTSALADGRQGWDWLSLQLDDGRDIMAFQIRDAAGAPAPESSGSLVDDKGVVRSFGASDFDLTPTGSWRSPRTGARYPSGWRLQLPGEAIDLRLTPVVADQELATGFRYWEGAVTVDGTSGGRRIKGRGYVELTGYAAPPAP